MSDAALTKSQEMLMAWLDDELAPEQRAEFERMMLEDPELAAEAARMQSLADLTRGMRLPEPTDREIRRFWARFYNRSEWTLGWMMLLGGVVVLLGEGLYTLVVTQALPWSVKTAALSTLVGGGLLLWNTMRLKLRASRFDRYRGVLR